MRFSSIKSWVASLCVLALVACGGGGGAGDPLLGGGGVSASNLTITLPAATLANTIGATIVATVTAVDANNATLGNVPVTLLVSGGATVTAGAEKTDANGRVLGTISIGGDTTPRTITLTATTSGVPARSASFNVVNSATTASDLSLTLSPSALLLNSGTASVVAVVTAVDANRATVSGIPVTLSVDNGATISTSGTVTNANGQVTGTISIGSDKSNRFIKVTAVTPGVAPVEELVQVTGSKITSTVVGSVLSPGDPGTVQYRLVDATGNPIPRTQLTITGPTGVQETRTTGINGDVAYSFTAPNTAGTFVIRASAAADVLRNDTVVVSSGPGTIPSVTAVVRSASVSANPSVVPINAAGNTAVNRTEIRALFLSDNNAPVKNVRVRFDLDGDPQSIGGSLSSGTTQVYSDANGVARTDYVPDARFSPTDGVKIRACWSNDDFAAGTCPNAARATLTVIADPLSISIGTSDEIGKGVSDLTYKVRYVVQVVDSSGLAAKDVGVSAFLDLLNYSKGQWVKGAESWVQVVSDTCPNEDLNRNGVSEVFTINGNPFAEDANGSFNLTAGRPALEPRKADVAVSFEGAPKTNGNGQVVLQIEYPQNVASWVEFNLVVSAGVAGTEGRANYKARLSVPAAVVIRLTASPPFQFSPYGLQASPRTAAVTAPGGAAAPVALCTNPD